MSETSRARVWLERLLPPVIAFLLAHGLLMLAAAEHGEAPLAPSTWWRRDSEHYLSIATQGYSLIPCRDNPANWCGNAGWFPLYPWLVRAAHLAFSDPNAGALLVSSLCAVLQLLVFWWPLLGGRWSWSGFISLMVLALWPGAIYQHALFPLALTGLCTLSAFALVERGRYGAAGVAGAGAAMAYTTGGLLAPALGLWLLRPWPGWRTFAYRLLAPIGVVVGYALVLANFQREVGAWDAQFKVQSKYGTGLHNPFERWWTWIDRIFHPPMPLDRWPSLQALAVTLLVFVLLARLWAHRATRQSTDTLAAIYLVAGWVLPYLVSKEVSYYRSEALLVPGALLVHRHLPLWARELLLVVLGVLGYWLGVLFFIHGIT